MDTFNCRLLPYEVASGAWNMAADEVLLEGAVHGVATLRFYGWSEPTVSLGYFQAASVQREDEQLAALPYVRRPTGGLMLVHHHELTYAAALPAGPPWQPRQRQPQSWLCRMHTLLRNALDKCGVSLVAAQCADRPQTATALCFRYITPGDLLIGTHKVVGSAQRRQRGALLQHGAVLLAASPYAPSLPGTQELCGRRPQVHAITTAFAEVWCREIGGELIPEQWSARERERVNALVESKYGRPAWNARR